MPVSPEEVELATSGVEVRISFPKKNQ